MDNYDKIGLNDEPNILSTSFNLDCTYFSVGTELGFQIYKTYPLELKLEKSTYIIYNSKYWEEEF